VLLLDAEGLAARAAQAGLAIVAMERSERP